MRTEFKLNLIPTTPDGLFLSIYLEDCDIAHDLIDQYEIGVAHWIITLLDPVWKEIMWQSQRAVIYEQPELKEIYEGGRYENGYERSK